MGIGYPVKIWNLLKSKTLAAILIFILAVVAAIGMLIPEISVFQTGWFAVLGIVFFVNLTSCTLQQIINAFRIWKKRNQLIKMGKNSELPVVTNDEVVVKFGQLLRGKRFKRVPGTADNLVWTKDKFGIWGASIFHIGLILITFGALVSGATKMSGYMKIAEGETRQELHENYEAIAEKPFFKETWHTGLGIMVNKQHVMVDQNGEIDNVVSDILIMKDGNTEKKVSLGKKDSVIYEGLRIFEKDSGFAPFIEITGPQKITLLKSYVLLETEGEGKTQQFHLKDFRIPNTADKVNIYFYPDMVVRGNKVTTNKLIMANPGVTVELTDSNRKTAKRVIKPGETVDLQGYNFKIGDIKQWSGFDIVNDRGAGYVFGGSWVALFGLILNYLFPYKKVQLYQENGYCTWKVIGITNRSRKIFEEELQELRIMVDNLIHKRICFEKKEL